MKVGEHTIIQDRDSDTTEVAADEGFVVVAHLNGCETTRAYTPEQARELARAVLAAAAAIEPSASTHSYQHALDAVRADLAEGGTLARYLAIAYDDARHGLMSDPAVLRELDRLGLIASMRSGYVERTELGQRVWKAVAA